ncbi:MAG: hypothetical protein CMP75_04830 [Flavobacteriales bacterium]|nr:hypothetical protein [Flavobacteriales bacterium]|tara:strand:+ start:845 stop:2947 length:2103 start_codon:yes stop_codon:yes gene_type:complete
MNNYIYDNILTHITAGNNVRYFLQPCDVYEFFKQSRVRKVPDYQRPYSWSQKNVDELLFDIEKVANDERESWFLGPVFSTKQQLYDDVSQVLDGQQRITTIQLILVEASIIKNRIQNLNLSNNQNLEQQLQSLITKCNESTFYYDNQSNLQIKFETENTIIDLFKNYIEKFIGANSKNYNEKVKEFEDEAKRLAAKGSPTANNLIEARETISKFLSQNFILQDTIKGVEDLIKFLTALLHKCWLIEVPIIEANASIQIFESLNNRGKSLTLSDKLRYKCLINCADDNYRDKLMYEWKDIYKGLDLLTQGKNSFFKNEEDFFKVFFNTINKKSISREGKFIQVFEDEYLKKLSKSNDPDFGIKKFIEDVLKIIDFYENVLLNSLSLKNKFVAKFISQNKEQHKVRALLQLVKKGLNFSDNSRFLLFDIILKYYDDDQHYILVQSIYSFCKVVFVYECLKLKKSQEIRNDFLGIVFDTNNNNITLMQYISDNDKTFSTNVVNTNNVLMTNDNNEASFIIYYYCYLNEYNSLIYANETQYKFEQLEHFFPAKWETNWKGSNFSKLDINQFLSDLEKKGNFSSYCSNLFKNPDNIPHIFNEIRQKETLELLKNDSKQKDTLLQFIGNKWVLHASHNISASNKSFEDKIKKYKTKDEIQLPINSNKAGIGFDSYNRFGYKEIILRSLIIIDGIFGSFKSEWDNNN